MTTVRFKKGQPLKIELRNGKKFDLLFVDYSNTTGLAYGKFRNSDGEFEVKPFTLDTIVNNN